MLSAQTPRIREGYPFPGRGCVSRTGLPQGKGLLLMGQNAETVNMPEAAEQRHEQAGLRENPYAPPCPCTAPHVTPAAGKNGRAGTMVLTEGGAASFFKEGRPASRISGMIAHGRQAVRFCGGALPAYMSACIKKEVRFFNLTSCIPCGGDEEI